MRWIGMRVGPVPVLGGFALALAILAVVVSAAQAETVCGRCQRLAAERAKSDTTICKGKHPNELGACVSKYINQQCFDTKICPDEKEAPATVKCEGYLEEGTTCDNGGTGICTNQTWNVNCEKDTSKKCQDTQIPPDGKIRPSVCYVKCECKQ